MTAVEAISARGPSVHLLWTELACHDGTPYPAHWQFDRAIPLAATFEDVRTLLGAVPLVILSGYRTVAYNATIEGAAQHSQHVEGRALDLWHPTMSPRDAFIRIRRAARNGHLPLLGAVGLYRTFVHIDVRPKVPKGHLAIWGGRGVAIPPEGA
jgi:hypothetical protein